MQAKNGKIIAVIFVGSGILLCFLALGFLFQLPWTMSLWLWPDSRLTTIVIAAIIAAAAAPMIWIGLSGEYGDARGGAAGMSLATASSALYLFFLYSQKSDPQRLITAVLLAIFSLLNLIIFFWSRRIPIRDQREKPFLVEFSFVLFVIALILIIPSLIRQTPRVFPWPSPSSSSTRILAHGI